MRTKYLGASVLLASLAILAGCRSPLSPPAGPVLAVVWQLDGNEWPEGQTTHTATFTLINTGTQRLGDHGWMLYWNQAPHGVLSTEGLAVVENINGDFYRLRPRPGFSLEPGDTVQVRYTSAGALIKHTDAPLGLYLAWETAAGEQTRPVAAYRVAPFTAPAQYTRGPEDAVPYPAPDWLYAQQAAVQVPPEAGPWLFLPAPQQWTPQPGHYALPDPVRIAAHPELAAEARYLATALSTRWQRTAIVDTSGDATGQIRLQPPPADAPAEGYRLAVDPVAGVEIIGSPAGAFYGIQSLLTLAGQPGPGLPAGRISDAPAFRYRGMHVDVGRNFQSKTAILRLLDAMARYKLNKLLLYLTEDEGWRIEIAALPELTEVGARRGHRHRDSLYLAPAYGSGPDPDDPQSPGNGYYSQADYREILRYAQARHIEVIPEINLPGHARAAIKAMERRYHRLMAAGQPEEAARYRLMDPEDSSRYVSAQGYVDNTACVCQESIYTFFETVVDALIALHDEAGVPLRMVHTGGDEVPATAWLGSPRCQDFLAAHPGIEDTRNLHGYFFDRIHTLLRARGLQNGAWEEAVMRFGPGDSWTPNPAYVGREVYPYIWNSLWGQQDLGYRLAHAGYPVILCHVSHFYFDLAHTKDPREPGLYWAGFVETEDAFSFVPYDVYAYARRDEAHLAPEAAPYFAGLTRLDPRAQAQILGLQGQLWGETLKGQDMLEYYYLPRMLALAQRAWEGQPAWAGQGEAARQAAWSRFMHTLAQVELPQLDRLGGGYAYRIPPPGIRQVGDSLYLNSAYPGFEIRYRTDGQPPTVGSPRYQGPFVPDGPVVTAACFDRRGRAGFSSTHHLHP